jgi:glycosyltransferase involved in cell wall biosynthesis
VHAAQGTDRSHVPVSVVIPAYNAEATLAATLASVLGQSRPASEVIVVDNRSTDQTARIAHSFGVRVESQPIPGVSAARNLGISRAAQPWIALLDADDLWAPNKIELQWAAHELHPEIGFVVCDTAQFDDASGKITLPSVLSHPPIAYEQLRRSRVAEKISLFPTIEPDFHAVGMFLFPSTALLRRDLLIKSGLFDTDLSSIADCECFQRVLSRSGLLVVEEPLMRYRVHANNMSHDSLQMVREYIAMAELVGKAPDRYSQGFHESVSSALPSRRFAAGELLLKAGRRREARSHFVAGLKSVWSVRAAALLAGAFLPGSLFAGMLQLRRSMRGNG